MDELINQTLLEKKDRLPLLFRLYELGRFARYFTPAGMKSVMTEMSAHIADNASSAQLSAEIKAMRIKTEKLILKREELNTAKQLLEALPEMAGTITLLEKELARIIIENNPPETDEMD